MSSRGRKRKSPSDEHEVHTSTVTRNVKRTDTQHDPTGGVLEADSADSAASQPDSSGQAPLDEDGRVDATDRKERFKALQARAVGSIPTLS